MIHEHQWEPVPLHQRQYRCSCGATGYKKLYRGEYNPNYPHAKVGDIIPHSTPTQYRDEVTADQASGTHYMGSPGCYQKGKLT